MTTKRKTAGKNPGEDRGDIGGGIFSSLAGFINNLGDLSEAGERLSQRRTAKQDRGDKGGASGEAAGGENRFGRILSGLTDIAEKLNEISEKGETVTKKGEFTFPTKKGGVKGVYGFSLKTGLGGKDDAIKVEPFGNIRKDKKTGEAVVQEIHEPLIDVFEDEDATTLIAEMPGVGTGDIKIDVRDDVLTISADKGEKKYRKEVLLSHSPAKDRIKVTCNNGIVTIRCEKA
ncbi:MAG: Hsp20/alpha crystallin family protein [Desulfobaccales bacterium]